MKTLEIYNELRRHIPADLAAGWDNEGIMVHFDPGREIKHALVTLDITDGAIETAVEKQCELIVSHHPVIFKPLKKLESPRLAKMVRAGISALSFHTSLDCADGGTADILAELLGLTDTEMLYDDGIPCGRLGRLPVPLDYHGLMGAVEKALSPRLTEVVSKQTGKLYNYIAVCPGEGKSLYGAALKSSADAFVCGAISYNELCDASEYNMTVITAGHYETEQPVCGRLSQLLSDLGIRNTIYKSNPIEISVQTGN